MRYSPALIEGLLMPGEDIIWIQAGFFDSRDWITGKRRKRSGRMVASNLRLVFFHVTRGRVQLESILYSQIQKLEIEKKGFFETLCFEVANNPCRLRCWSSPLIRGHLYWLRQRCSVTSASWHTGI